MRHRARVLWVEDDTYALRYLSEGLRDLGFDVLQADTMDRAVELLHRDGANIDAAILDIAMPPGTDFSAEDTRGGFDSGVSLARYIRDNYPNIVVIGCSAFGEGGLAQWFCDHAQGFLAKPTTPHEMATHLEKVLSLPSLPEPPRTATRAARLIVGVIGIVASLVTLLAFVSGKVSLAQLLDLVKQR